MALELQFREKSSFLIKLLHILDCLLVIVLLLAGAISLEEFKSLRPTLPKDREIVFYCA
jgi:rhodanese-related sulfurtransferase